MTAYHIYTTFYGATVTLSCDPIRGTHPGWKATLTHDGLETGKVLARASGFGMSRTEVKAHIETLWGADAT